MLSSKVSKAGGPCLYRLKGIELSKSTITHETVQYCFVLHYKLNRTVFVTHTHTVLHPLYELLHISHSSKAAIKI